MNLNPGDIVTVDFPGVARVKRRPAVVLSSATYHATRPDIIIGLITSQPLNAVGELSYTVELSYTRVSNRLCTALG